MGQQVDVRALNVDLCRALGVTDTSDVSRVELVIEANQIPRITVTRQPVRSDMADKLVAAFDLVPRPVPVNPPPAPPASA